MIDKVSRFNVHQLKLVNVFQKSCFKSPALLALEEAKGWNIWNLAILMKQNILSKLNWFEFNQIFGKSQTLDRIYGWQFKNLSLIRKFS